MASDEGPRREALDRLAAEIRACTRCRLHAERTVAVPGEGPLDAGVVVVGEAPGRQEDAAGRPFVGSAGKVLDAALSSAGLARDDAFVTNVVKCRPPTNRRPRSDEVEACRPYLLAQIELVRPKVLVTLGATGLAALLGSGVEVKDARARTNHALGLPLVATYHPAAVLYSRRLERDLAKDLRKVARHVRPAKPRVRSEPPRPGVGFETSVSSGGVIANAEGRILLLKRSDEEIWCLPKGTVESGETLEAAARREILEETGLRVKLLRPLVTIHYRYFWPPKATNVDKTVAYFLAEPIGGRVSLESGFDDGRWVTHAQALRLLHWKNDKDVVTRAFEILRLAPS
ncbi:MAG: uracil-DNA glycosylase family protein [Methanobacteriota archaeon]